MGTNTVTVRISYPKTFKGRKFLKEGRDYEVSPETRDIYRQKGILLEDVSEIEEIPAEKPATEEIPAEKPATEEIPAEKPATEGKRKYNKKSDEEIL